MNLSKTSTMSQNSNLHVKTLLRSAVEGSPLRRRSLIQTPIVLLDKCDDENERSNRRSLVEFKKRLSNIPGTSVSVPNESTKLVEERDIKEHLQICTKLFTENKITSKNAWKLHIIDLLNHMAQKQAPDTLKVAGTTLDISAKVYGIRVDDIHADSLKLASSIARTTENKSLEDVENGDDSENNYGQEKGKHRVKRKRRFTIAGKRNTISKDPKSLKAPLQKLESVFFSNRTDTDASAIDNLFTNTLKTDNSGYKFMLLSTERACVGNRDPVVSDSHTKGKKYTLKLRPLENFTICAPFNDFQIDEWDPDQEAKYVFEKTLISQKQQEVVYDDNGLPIPELDGSIHDIFANNDSHSVGEPVMDIEDEMEEHLAPQIGREVAHIVDFKPDEFGTLQKSEYSYSTVVNAYSGKVIDQIWAGPSHWKFKYIRGSQAKFSGQTVIENHAVKNTRKKTVPEMINFDVETELFDLTKKLTIKKKPPTADFEKITLPIPDFGCIQLFRNISELMSKPGTCPVRKKTVEDVDCEIPAYKYDNPNDSQYCSRQLENSESFEDGCAADSNANFFNCETEDVVAQQNFMGENLIAVPEGIPNSYVLYYAMQAKKVDMKLLKAAVWKCLEQSINGDSQPNVTSAAPTLFSTLYREVPKMLPDKMRRDVSCHLIFFALLHLCNEQNLRIKQCSDFTDFEIFV